MGKLVFKSVEFIQARHWSHNPKPRPWQLQREKVVTASTAIWGPPSPSKNCSSPQSWICFPKIILGGCEEYHLLRLGAGEVQPNKLIDVPCRSGKPWINRRKFRSQTSDNMDRWKSRGGKSQRGEAKKWEEQRRERERRKKMQVREKVGKSRFTVFFQWFVAQWSKSRLAKAAGAEPSGQMRDEQLYAVVAQRTFRSQN